MDVFVSLVGALGVLVGLHVVLIVGWWALDRSYRKATASRKRRYHYGGEGWSGAQRATPMYPHDAGSYSEASVHIDCALLLIATAAMG